ncbi:MAG: Ig-like domain-containing protein [Ginsengibacter sp.]
MKKHFYSNQSTPLRTCKGHSKIFNKWFMFLLLVVFVAGCKKVTEEAGLIGVCPIVIATNPADAATAVSLNTKVNATFNEAMDPSTMTATTFTVTDGTTPIAGVITYAGTTVTFSPTKDLTASTKYTGTITTGVRDMAHNAMVSNYVWNFTTGTGPDLVRPTVISTDPVNAATGVALNKKISATFSEVMDSVSVTTSFTLVNTTLGGTAITGTVTYSGTTGIFSPSVDLDPNTTYTGIITTGAKDLAGNTLLSDYTWNFTTGADLIPPTVISTDPTAGATGVVLDKKITATFSEIMNSATITNVTFLLKQGATAISGTVTYAGTTAKFSPSVNLAYNTTYTATITTGAKDFAGNALAANYVWSFTTLQATIPPTLKSDSSFGAFGGSAGITNQGITTMINNGGIGTTAASTLITGFHDGMTAAIYTETPLNKGNSTGGIYTAPPAPGTAPSFVIATQALADANASYNSISPASKPGGTDPGAGELGGLTLPPGVYKSASGTFKITNLDLTLDAMGDPNAVWIFQTAAELTVGAAGPAGARSVILINGAQPRNVYWHIGSAAVINAAGGGVMVGTIIASAGVTFSTAGNAVQTVLNGRAISLVASVTMVNTTINVP